jgi:hypothetical protein
MALRVVVALAFVILAGWEWARAEDSVKQAIFEDCDQAMRDFSARSVEEQASLAEFLARVLALSTQSPSAPEAFAVAPGTSPAGDAARLSAPKSPDLLSGALWQTLDAKRELKAKRCALELLRSAGSSALHVLPNLVGTYSEQALSDEIAVGLEETAADIAERAHKQNAMPSAEDFSAIASHVLGQRPLVARSVIQEFLPDSLPHLLLTLSSSSAPRPEIVRYLSEADPGGALVMRAYISLTASAPPEKLATLSSLISIPEKTLLTGFINDFVRLSRDSRYSQIFLPLLGATCHSLGGFAIDSAQQNEIAQISELLRPDALPPEHISCLLAAAPTLGKNLLPLLAKDAPPAQSRLALSVINAASGRLAPEIKSDLYGRVRDFAVDTGSDLELDAIRCLANFEQAKTDNAQAALSIFKTLPSLPDPSRREALSLAVIDMLDRSGLGKEPNRFATYVKPYLLIAAPPAVALRVAAKIPQLEGQLLTLALAVPPSAKSAAALSALAPSPNTFKRSIPGLLELLRYPEVQQIAEQILVGLGPAASAALKKSISRPSWGSRSQALAALVGLKSASKTELSELATTLATREGCSFVSSHSATLCSLAANADRDPSLRAHLASAVQRCISEMSAQQLDQVARCSPDLILSASDTIASFLSTHGDNERLAPVVNFIAQQMPPLPQQAQLLTSFLTHGSQATRASLLPVAALLGGDHPEINRAIKGILQSAEADSNLRLIAAKALAGRGEKDFNWSEFVQGVIRTNGKQGIQPQALEVISLLPADTVLAEVLPALESDSQEKLVGGALVGAALGSKAVPIVSRLWHLREARSPMVRYVAILALLQINPLTPDMHGEVTKILVNRYFPVARQVPIKWSHTAALVDMDRSTFGSLRKERLEELLRSER